MFAMMSFLVMILFLCNITSKTNNSNADMEILKVLDDVIYDWCNTVNMNATINAGRGEYLTKSKKYKTAHNHNHQQKINKNLGYNLSIVYINTILLYNWDIINIKL